MKRIIFILSFFFVFLGIQAQIGRFPFPVANVVSGSSGSVTDHFNYSDGDLNGKGSWVKSYGTITISSNTIYPNSADTILYYWNDATVTNNQYAQLDVSGNSSRNLGIACRITGNSYYFAYYGSGNVALEKMVNGVRTSLKVHYSVSEPVTIKLEVSGTTLKVYVNGVQDATIGDITDTDLSSGYIGLFGQDASSVRVGDNFVGGNL